MYSHETLKKLILVLRKYPDIWILSDDIYEKLNFSSENQVNIINIDKESSKKDHL